MRLSNFLLENAVNQVAEMEVRLRLLEDERALQRLINDYLNLADQRRWREWSETFVEDAVFDLPNSFGLMKGRQEIYDVCVGKMEGVWDRTQHMIINTQFDVEGDHANGTANIIFAAVPAGAAITDYYMMGGQYRWKFVHTHAGWKIADAWEEFIWNNGTPFQTVFEVEAN